MNLYRPLDKMVELESKLGKILEGLAQIRWLILTKWHTDSKLERHEDLLRWRNDLFLNEETWHTIQQALKSRHKEASAKAMILKSERGKSIVELSPSVSSKRAKIYLAMRREARKAGYRDLSNLDNVIWKASNQSRRKKSWVRLARIGQSIGPQVLELAKARNAIVQTLGYSDLTELYSASDGLPRDEIARLFRNVLEETDDLYQQCYSEARKFSDSRFIGPWDERYLFSRATQPPRLPLDVNETFRLVRRFAKLRGFETREVALKVSNRRLPFNALTFLIKVPSDIRILARKRHGYRLLRTLVHELGHAIYASNITSESPVFKYFESRPLSEGVSETFAYLALLTDWMPDNNIIESSVIGKLRRNEMILLLRDLRSNILLTLTELEFYKKETLNISETTSHSSYNFPDELQIQSMIPLMISQPISAQSIVLAELIAFHLLNFVLKRFPRAPDDTRISNFFTNSLFATGSFEPWRSRIRKSTSSSLHSNALINALRSAIRQTNAWSP